jgi:hypothetical protein
MITQAVENFENKQISMRVEEVRQVSLDHDLISEVRPFVTTSIRSVIPKELHNRINKEDSIVFRGSKETMLVNGTKAYNVNHGGVFIGTYVNKVEAAIAYDDYIRNDNFIPSMVRNLNFPKNTDSIIINETPGNTPTGVSI